MVGTIALPYDSKEYLTWADKVITSMRLTYYVILDRQNK